MALIMAVHVTFRSLSEKYKSRARITLLEKLRNYVNKPTGESVYNIFDININTIF